MRKLKEKKTILYLLLILGIVFLAAIAFGFGKGINTIGEVVYIAKDVSILPYLA